MKLIKSLTNLKIQATSVQSIIIGSVISGVIASAGIAMLWPSVDSAKIKSIASHMKSQMLYVNVNAGHNFKKIEDIYNSAISDGDDDYLDELSLTGELKDIPKDIFESPDKLTWEIRKVTEDGYKKMFYIHIESEDTKDNNLIIKAIESLDLKNSAINI